MPSLQDVLTEKRIPFAIGGQHRNVREGWIGLDCPWCGPDSGKYHLGVHPDSLTANCWQCGGKNLGEALALVLRIPTPQARGLVKGLPRRPRTPSKAGLRRGVLGVPRGLGPLLEPHRGHLRGRGFDTKELERIWGLRGIGLASRLAWRIWIPVHLDGEVVSWTTRATGRKEGAKYVSADPDEEVWPIKTLLYGWDYVRSTAIVCEGPADVWRIGPGVVATFGLNVTTAQMDLLTSVPYRIVCFDNEPKAQKTAEKLCRELESFPGETTNVRLDSSDPGCATDREVEVLRNLLKGEQRWRRK
jgi:hypothetical protein